MGLSTPSPRPGIKQARLLLRQALCSPCRALDSSGHCGGTALARASLRELCRVRGLLGRSGASGCRGLSSQGPVPEAPLLPQFNSVSELEGGNRQWVSEGPCNSHPQTHTVACPPLPPADHGVLGRGGWLSYLCNQHPPQALLQAELCPPKFILSPNP